MYFFVEVRIGRHHKNDPRTRLRHEISKIRVGFGVSFDHNIQKFGDFNWTKGFFSTWLVKPQITRSLDFIYTNQIFESGKNRKILGGRGTKIRSGGGGWET